MGRKKRWPPVVTKHSTGQARVRWKGRDYYLGTYGTPQATEAYIELLKTLGQAEQEQEDRQAHPQKLLTLTVLNAAQRFIDTELIHKPTKERNHYLRWMSILESVCKGMVCDDFDTRVLDRIREGMIQKQWSRGVINAGIRRVRTMWRWIESQGYAPRGSWDHLRSLPPLRNNDSRIRTTKPRQPVEWNVVEKVCNTCRADVKAILLLLWHTGMRPGEAVLMRSKDIDRSEDVWFFSLEQHKNSWRGQSRIVALGPQCQEILTPFLIDVKDDEYLFSPDGRKKQRRRPYYTAEKLSQYVKRACLRVGVKMTPYQLRHTAKQRITREFGLDSARAMLGQNHLQTTDKYAASGDRKLAAEVAKKLG